MENLSRMLNRRVDEAIGTRYTDIAQREPRVADELRILEQHEAIDTNERR